MMEDSNFCNDGNSSGSSSPEPSPLFSPEFSVSVEDKVIKDGDNLRFTIHVLQKNHTVQVVKRIFEDFEYLEHCVITDQPSHGIIVPPLPEKSAIDAQAAEANSKKQMGKNSKTLLGDNYAKDCIQLQKYLELLLCHPVLGRSVRLREFLTKLEAPPRTKLRKSMLSKLSDVIEARKAAYPDCEDFFQKEREWVSKYSPALNTLSEEFNKTVYSQKRITHQLEKFVVSLKLTNGFSNEDLSSKTFSVLNHSLVNCMENLQSQMEEKCLYDDLKVSCCLRLWSGYLLSEESMLLHRTCLMVDYHSCNRALEKAKPNRKHLAEKCKKEAEVLFEECSDAARKEIKRLHDLRTSELFHLLDRFFVQQVVSARSALATLQTTLEQVKAVGL